MSNCVQCVAVMGWAGLWMSNQWCYWNPQDVSPMECLDPQGLIALTSCWSDDAQAGLFVPDLYAPAWRRLFHRFFNYLKGRVPESEGKKEEKRTLSVHSLQVCKIQDCVRLKPEARSSVLISPMGDKGPSIWNIFCHFHRLVCKCWMWVNVTRTWTSIPIWDAVMVGRDFLCCAEKSI